MHRDDHYRLCTTMVCTLAYTAPPILNQQENQSPAVLTWERVRGGLSSLRGAYKILHFSAVPALIDDLLLTIWMRVNGVSVRFPSSAKHAPGKSYTDPIYLLYLLCEIGLFAPDKRRTQSIVCETNGELYAMTDETIYRLYYQNPKLGFYLMRLIVERLFRDLERKTPAPATV